MPGISIIIPIYNSEKYLESCLLSVEQQTWTDYEVILVDDGSTDSSGAICDAFCSRNKRFHVYHVNNNGVSYARNIGIEKARGEYITFVDSDDEISDKYLSVLMVQDSCELVIAKISSKRTDLYNSNEMNKTVDKCSVDEHSLSTLVNQRTINTVCAKRFSRAIINDRRIRFHDEMSLGEDTLFLAEYLRYCKQFASTNCIVYYYRVDNACPTLSQYNSEYILKLESANSRIATALSQIDPYVMEKDYWELREWKVYYQAIIQILNSKRSISQKNQLITSLFDNPNFVKMAKNADSYMIGDGKTLRRMIKKRNSLKLVLYWNCRKLFKRVLKQNA